MASGIACMLIYPRLKLKLAFSSVALASAANGFSISAFAWFASKGYVEPAALVAGIWLTAWTMDHLLLAQLLRTGEYALIGGKTVPRVYGENTALIVASVSAGGVSIITPLLGMLARLAMEYVIALMVVSFGFLFLTVEACRKRRPSLAFKCSNIYIGLTPLLLAFGALTRL